MAGTPRWMSGDAVETHDQNEQGSDVVGPSVFLVPDAVSDNPLPVGSVVSHPLINQLNAAVAATPTDPVVLPVSLQTLAFVTANADLFGFEPVVLHGVPAVDYPLPFMTSATATASADFDDLVHSYTRGVDRSARPADRTDDPRAGRRLSERPVPPVDGRRRSASADDDDDGDASEG